MERSEIISLSTDVVNKRFEGYLNPDFPCDDCKLQKFVGTIKRCAKGNNILRVAYLKDCSSHIERDVSLDNHLDNHQ